MDFVNLIDWLDYANLFFLFSGGDRSCEFFNSLFGWLILFSLYAKGN